MESFGYEFTLNDGMSQALKSITNSLAGTLNYLEDVNKSIGAVDKQNFNSLKKNISSACSNVDSIRQEFDQAVGNVNNFEKSVNSINGNGLNSIKKSAENVSASLGEIGSEATASAASINKIASGNLNSISSAANVAAEAVDDLGDEAEQTESQLERIDNSSNVLNNNFNNLKSTVMGAVAAFASFETIKGAINLSDEITQTTSRLNLMNDGMQSTEELQNQIKEAALSSHAEYQTLADTVAKLGNNAGAAFSSSSEIVDFAEQLSKQFAISGASADEMAAATLQLTQGLSSGVLRGDEFNSVMEQAPGIAQMLADYLQVDRSQIRDLASEGALTADVVKKAVLGATNETDQKFDQMRVTFGQLWTDFKTNAMFAFVPISEALSNVANNKNFQNAISEIGKVVNSLGQSAAPVIESVGNAFVNGFSWIVDNWQVLASGIGAVVTALVSFSAANSVISTIQNVKTSYAGLLNVINSGGTSQVSGIAAIGKWLAGLINPVTLATAGVIALAAATAYFIATGTKVSDIQQGFSNFDEAVNSFVSGFGSFVSDIVTSIQNNLPAIAAQAGTIMSTLVTGLLNSAVNLIGAGAQIVLQLIVGLAQAMPTIVSSGFTFITNFLSGLMAGIPQLADTALTIIENFIGSLAENLPTLIQSGVDTIVAWIQGMNQSQSNLFTQAVVMISGFIQTIGEHLPEIISKGFELITSLVTGILQALPSIAQAAISLIGNFVLNIIQNLPTIIQAGINLVGGLISGLVQSIPALLTGLAQLLGAIIDGIAQAVPQVWNSALEMGGQLIQGLWNGIQSAWTGFTGWLGSLWEELLNNVKSFFGIASPSTVFNDIGANLLQGLWNGLQSIWSGLESWIGGVWDSIKGIFSGGSETEVDYTATIESTKAQIQQLQDIVSQGFSNILSNIQATLGQITAATTAQFGVMSQAVLAQIGVLVTQTGVEISAIGGSFNAVFANLIAVVSASMAQLKANTLAQVAQMVAEMANTASGLSSIFTNIFGTIASATVQVIETLKQNSISVLQELSNQATSLIGVLRSNMESTVQGMSQTVIASFTLTKTEAITTISTMSAGLQSTYTTMVNNILSQVQRMADSMKSTVLNLVQALSNSIGSLPRIFGEAANSMMQSLKSGIDSNKQSIVDTTSDLVQKLKTTFEQGLGIHSPSDYMIWIGQMMLAGLMEGMSQSQITAFIESTIQDMQTSFEGGTFNAAETMDYLSQQGALDLIAKVTGMDLSAVEGATPTSIPAIIEEARKYKGYKSPGGLDHASMFGMRYGNPGAWCVSFVRYCAENVGVPFPATNYVPDVTSWAQSNGKWTMTPQPGYAAIFSNRHIELVADVAPNGVITYIGGNTGGGEVKERPRTDATGFVALDGGHAVATTLAATLQNAYTAKYNPTGLAMNIPAYTGDISALLNSYMNQPVNLDITGSGLENPAWFQQWTPPEAVARWSPQVLAVLKMLGQPASLLKGVLFAINGESGGDPNSTYLGDENIVYGGSKGLLQTITPNFEKWKNPQLPNDIYDPMQNIWTCLREMQDTYGGISNLINRKIRKGGWSGYAVGTRYVPQDMLAMIHKGEAILPASQNPYSESGGDYIGDMISDNLPEYELNSFLRADDAIVGTGGSSTSNNANISLYITQNINDSTNSRSTANEIVDILYDALEEQFNSKGGGVVLEY